MTRPAFLLLLLIPLLTACGMSHADLTATAESHVEPRMVQESPTAGNTPVAAYTAAPNYTEAALVHLAELQFDATLEERDYQRRVYADGVAQRETQAAYVGQTQTRLPIDRATASALRETANAAEWLRMTQLSNQATWTHAAPIDQATTAQLQADAKNADLNAWGFPVGWIAFSFAMLIFSLIIAVAFFYNRTYHPAITRANDEKMPPIATSQNSKDFDTTPPGGNALFSVFLESHALQGKPLGRNSVKSDLYSQDMYKRVSAWMGRVNKRRVVAPQGQTLPSLFTPGPNNSTVLSPSGIDYYYDWLDLYRQSPSPIVDIPKNMTPAPYGHVENDHFGQWGDTGGVVDIAQNSAGSDK